MRTVFLLAPLALAAALAQGQAILESTPDQIPEWAQQGKFRFTRLDGGPIEVRKTSRSAWGMHFNEHEKEVLSNLYTKYSDRMVGLLAEANVNWVWITWSVGFSEAEEAEQRAHAKAITDELHARGIKVAAYICAVSMFWESMFRDYPRSVRWILFDNEGVPYRYSGGRDPLRFIADVSHPEWVDYQKRRIGGIVDAGLDAIFFDNTSVTAWNSAEKLTAFIDKLRRHAREDKRSGILFFTNYGLHPQGLLLNRNMDFVFNEGWQEPGVWGADWQVANIRRMKYVRAAIPDWKPLTSEYSIFRSGNRATTWLAPRSQKLGIAEAAVFRSAFCWDMEGPFDGALMKGDPNALAAWKAIAQYNGFLKEHEGLYVGARSVAPVAVLAPADRGNFTWNKAESEIYDFLSRRSVLYDIQLAGAKRDGYRVVIDPASPEWTASESGIQKLRAAVGDAPWLEVEGAPHVIGTVTRAGGRHLVHLLNYSPEPANAVRVRLNLAGRPHLVTPDAGAGGLSRVARKGAALEFTVDKLDIYSVVVLE